MLVAVGASVRSGMTLDWAGAKRGAPNITTENSAATTGRAFIGNCESQQNQPNHQPEVAGRGLHHAPVIGAVESNVQRTRAEGVAVGVCRFVGYVCLNNKKRARAQKRTGSF